MYNDFFTTGVQEQAADNFIESMFALGGIFIALAIIIAIVFIAVVVLIIIANARLNVKAGEKWWKALVPLYNSWIQVKISGLAWYWFVIYLVLLAWTFGVGVENANTVWAMAGVLTSFNVNYNICKKFGKSNAFAFWMTVLPVVFLPILAFGSAKYNKSAEVDENGVFSIKK